MPGFAQSQGANLQSSHARRVLAACVLQIHLQRYLLESGNLIQVAAQLYEHGKYMEKQQQHQTHTTNQYTSTSTSTCTTTTTTTMTSTCTNTSTSTSTNTSTSSITSISTSTSTSTIYKRGVEVPRAEGRRGRYQYWSVAWPLY